MKSLLLLLLGSILGLIGLLTIDAFPLNLILIILGGFTIGYNISPAIDYITS